MVNSVLRTVAFQHSLATWGYVAPRRSAHLAGYAADIEKSWYERHAPRVCRSLELVVSDLVERDVIYAVDERTHWHICLNPAHIPLSRVPVLALGGVANAVCGIVGVFGQGGGHRGR